MEQLTPTLIQQLISSFNLYLFCSILGALALKELAIATLNYIRMRFSGYGMGTKFRIGDDQFYLESIHFTYIRFRKKDAEHRLFIPVTKFLTMDKFIMYNGNED